MNDRSLRTRCTLGSAMALMALLVLLLALPVTAQAVSHSTQELEFLRLINEYRQENGLGTLLLSDRASDAAEKHSGDMAKYGWFSHDSQQSDYYPYGSTPWYRLAQSGYSAASMGENIAAGQTTAAEVFAAWKGSSSHDSNMRVATHRVIGIGLVYLPGSPYRYYWTTDFGSFADDTAHDPSAPTPTTSTTAPAVASTPSLIAGGPGSYVQDQTVFWFDGSAYHSSAADAMVAGKGYWARLTTGPVNLTTDAAAGSLTLVQGWNLIGNATGSSRSLPSNFVAYRFNGSSYFSSTLLPSGEGAWVRSPSAGTLVLR